MPENRLTPSTPHVFLIGYRGCGKSTVGRLLADKLGRPFVDSDVVIEQQGRSIRQIFQESGEEAFRLLMQNAPSARMFKFDYR